MQRLRPAFLMRSPVLIQHILPRLKTGCRSYNTTQLQELIKRDPHGFVLKWNQREGFVTSTQLGVFVGILVFLYLCDLFAFAQKKREEWKKNKEDRVLKPKFKFSEIAPRMCFELVMWTVL